MKRFFCSDYHFFHTNVIKYCDRPFKDIPEMHRVLIENWNKVVGPRDTVYFIGDFAFGKNEAQKKAIVSKLNGYKVLILGNHDDSASKMKAMGFDEVHRTLKIAIDGQEVILHHYPYRPKDESGIAERDLKRLRRRPEDQGGWLIHGHVHQYWKQKGRMINVSAEVWNYTPASESEIMELMKSGPQDRDVKPFKARAEESDSY